MLRLKVIIYRLIRSEFLRLKLIVNIRANVCRLAQYFVSSSLLCSTALCWAQGFLDGGSARLKAATYTQKKHPQTSTPPVGFEPMISVLERARQFTP
jgi:hypothetical protein